MYRSIDSFVAQSEVSNLNLIYHQFGTEKRDLQNSATLSLDCGENPTNPFNASQIYDLDIRKNLESNIR